MKQEEYTKQKKRLLNYGRVCFGNNLDKQALEILADDALSTAHENKIKGAYTKTDAQFSTYIFTIFKNKCLNYIKSLEVRKKHRDFVKRQHGNGSHASRNSFLEKEAYTQVIQEAMSELCDKCQKVLVLKYFEGKSMDEIAAAMNLKNRDVAKSKRYECFNKLQKIVKKRYSKDELF